MKAILIKEQGSPPLLSFEETETPVLGDEEVLIKISAAGVNRADLVQAAGKYPPPPGESEILGLEAAGVIENCGAKVSAWKEGDRVCALLAGGGYAEFVNVHQEMLLAIPDSMSFEQAAAIPEAWYTAYVNLFLEGGLKEGESVLIHAGASGVGTAAIQLAKAKGARVFVTAGSSEKTAVCQELGADVAVNYREQDFAEVIGKNQIDLVLDCVGKDYLARNLQVLNTNGRLVLIGLLSGSKAEIDLVQVLRKKIKLIGSTLRSRSLAEKIAITQQFKADYWLKFASGELKPIVDRTFALPDAAKALQFLRENKSIGKVILL